TAACNSYGGPVEIEGDRIVLGGLAVTEMACEPPRVMAAEAAYLDALGVTDTIRREGRMLVLTGPSAELRFEPLQPVDQAP
ncbi:MAG TPA: META domain-containing protein, partial [Gaiellaceae bacterium]|nr:META domain-containing protein [Gaiellaceae bacterium]